MTNFDDVRKFHDAFEIENRETPSFPDDKTCKLRIELIREEFIDELIPAIEARDIVAVADALTDILYVAYGAGLAFGIDLDACFAEVQRSNMSKLGEDGKPIRREDGKVLKGPNYSPPDLKAVLDKQVLEIGFAKFVAAAELVTEQRTAQDWDHNDYEYEHREWRNGEYSWAVVDDIASYDFNRDVLPPGDEGADEFTETGVIGLRCDDDFWVVATLPYGFLGLDAKTMVKHLWPTIYAEAVFKPDSDDVYWDEEWKQYCETVGLTEE